MWSENYAFMINDSAQGIAAFCLMGRWIKDPSIWRELLMVQLPDGSILHHKAWGAGTSANVVSASLTRIELLPERNRFHLSFYGPIARTAEDELRARGPVNQPLTPCRISIDISSDVPVWDMSGHASSAEQIAGRMHVEQVGSASGTIEVDGRRYELRDAFMQRDHSSGVRDVSLFRRHCWAQGRFPQRDLTFNLYSMIVFGSEDAPMMNASVTQGGRRYPAAITEMVYLDSRDEVRKPYGLTLQSELGEMHFRVVDFVASFPTAFISPWDMSAGTYPDVHCVTGLEEAVVWEWDDLRGDGWSERSYNDRPFASPELPA